jgi:hypothetical protein
MVGSGRQRCHAGSLRFLAPAQTAPSSPEPVTHGSALRDMLRALN